MALGFKNINKYHVIYFFIVCCPAIKKRKSHILSVLATVLIGSVLFYRYITFVLITVLARNISIRPYIIYFFS